MQSWRKQQKKRLGLGGSSGRSVWVLVEAASWGSRLPALFHAPLFFLSQCHTKLKQLEILFQLILLLVFSRTYATNHRYRFRNTATTTELSLEIHTPNSGNALSKRGRTWFGDSSNQGWISRSGTSCFTVTALRWIPAHRQWLLILIVTTLMKCLMTPIVFNRHQERTKLALPTQSQSQFPQQRFIPFRTR